MNERERDMAKIKRNWSALVKRPDLLSKVLTGYMKKHFDSKLDVEVSHEDWGKDADEDDAALFDFTAEGLIKSSKGGVLNEQD